MHEDYPVHSRVHALKIAPHCYIKREDELGFFLSGSKVRKYRSHIAALKKEGAKEAKVYGSANSNHVLGLSMLLIENGIRPKLFLLQPSSEQREGIGLFIELLVPKHDITYVPRSEWKAQEGGSLKDSVSGLTTLALDIIRNEQDLGITFENILIDSGSGMTAATLIAALGLLKKAPTVHVMQTALSDEAFLNVLQETKSILEELTGEKIENLPPFIQHRPTTARSFGATNAKVFNTIKSASQHEGFFLEPIYSAKLYLLLEDLLKKGELTGPTLFIHSGGLFSLAGFQKQLLALC